MHIFLVEKKTPLINKRGLEGETFLRNKHKIAFSEIKCTFFLVEKKTPLINKMGCGGKKC